MSFSLIGMLILGLAAGWLANKIMGGGKPGLVGLLVVGVLGSFVGGFVFQLIGFKTVGFPANLITSVVGAVLCILAIRHWGKRF